MTQEHRPLATSEAGHSVVDLLHRGSQVAEDCFSRTMTVTGITPRQFAVLAAVARAPNANQTDIVHMTGVDRSTMADIVRRLVKKQLLQRRRTREDARAYAISLTPQAEDVIQKLSSDRSKAEELLLAALSQEDRARLLGLLQQVIDSTARQDGQKLPRQAADGRPTEQVRY